VHRYYSKIVSVSELENKKAVEDSIKIYQELLSQHVASFPIEQSDLYQHHLASAIKAKEEFSVRSLGEAKEEYIVQLEVRFKTLVISQCSLKSLRNMKSLYKRMT
jgi:hypothetical protein